jgi:hypothetical protein
MRHKGISAAMIIVVAVIILGFILISSKFINQTTIIPSTTTTSVPSIFSIRYIKDNREQFNNSLLTLNGTMLQHCVQLAPYTTMGCFFILDDTSDSIQLQFSNTLAFCNSELQKDCIPAIGKVMKIAGYFRFDGNSTWIDVTAIQ